MPSSLTAISSTGARLDADFSLDLTVEGFDVIIESRSGGKRGKTRPRNPDYEKLFELVLERAAALGARFDGAWVVSADTVSLPADARLLSAPEYPYPIDLSAVTSFRELRTTISGRQGAIGRRAGARGPGNRNKRVLLSFGLDQPPGETELVEAVLTGSGGSGGAVVANLLAAPPARNRGPGSLAALQQLLEKYTHAAPQVREKISKRIERGWIGDRVKAAYHYRCQICVALGCDERTFRKRDGNAYVETHHVDPVSHGAAGALRPENVLVVCAPHHRELHYGAAARIVDHGDRFEVVVELGTAMIPKTDLLALLEEGGQQDAGKGEYGP